VGREVRIHRSRFREHFELEDTQPLGRRTARSGLHASRFADGREIANRNEQRGRLAGRGTETAEGDTRMWGDAIGEAGDVDEERGRGKYGLRPEQRHGIEKWIEGCWRVGCAGFSRVGSGSGEGLREIG
jgi:hypothetical protein